jgi:5-methylcytosine-specific restriction enzyme A
VCAACGELGSKRQLELHHLDYVGMSSHDGRWIAREAHDDLIPMHPACHELLHRLIDRDPILARHRTRRDATHIALQKLHPILHQEPVTP